MGDLHSVCTFRSGFLHSLVCLWNASMLLQGAVAHSFPMQCIIPVHKYSITHVLILLVDVWFCLSRMKLLTTNLFFQFEVYLTNKNCIYLKCTT